MKRSKIWEVPETEFRAIVARSASFLDVLRKIGVSRGGYNYERLKKRLKMLHIDSSHLSGQKERVPENKIPLDKILIEHSTYPRYHLKNRLIENDLLENVCAICGLGPEWAGKEFVLALDHVNGIKDNNRLENLRLVCPNCHSQTETFSGKNASSLRRNSIWSIPETILRDVVSRSTSLAEILRHFGLSLSSRKYRALKKRIAFLEIDISHIPQRPHSDRGRKLPSPKHKIPLKDILVEHSTYHRNHLKNRLIESNLLSLKCAICGRKPEWNGKELVLVLDHINGVNDDNRLENLRLLCPNCNSQTATFAGKHISKPKKEYTCQECRTVITKYSKTGLCHCCAMKNRRKAERPPRAVLEKLVEKYGFSRVGRVYGVSDNAIRKWLRKNQQNE